MSTFDAQSYQTAQKPYLVKEITFEDDGLVVSLGWIPAGAIVTNAYAVVTTAFDGDTTNTVDLGFQNAGDGTTTDPDEFLDGAALGTAGVITGSTLATAGDVYFPEGAEVIASVTSTAGATAGAAYAVVEYVELGPFTE